MAITIPLITEFKDRGLKDAETAFDRFNTKAKKAFGGLLDLTKKVAIGAGALAGAAAAPPVNCLRSGPSAPAWPSASAPPTGTRTC
jgi:hypothetical protein